MIACRRAIPHRRDAHRRDAHGYDELDEPRGEWGTLVQTARSAPLVSSANVAYIEAVLAKCTALRLSKLWPDETVIRPRGWLDNFADEDRTAAAVLLDAFTFFSAAAKVRLLVGAFESASRTPPRSPLGLPANFFRDAVFTPVLGETPNVTDSGGADESVGEATP